MDMVKNVLDDFKKLDYKRKYFNKILDLKKGINELNTNTNLF